VPEGLALRFHLVRVQFGQGIVHEIPALESCGLAFVGDILVDAKVDVILLSRRCIRHALSIRFGHGTRIVTTMREILYCFNIVKAMRKMRSPTLVVPGMNNDGVG
jgi:hypothetical protein